MLLLTRVVAMPLADPARKVLVVCLRRLGDVLLTTPLGVSIRAAWPESKIDWLVFKGTEGILQNNPAADRTITLEPQANVTETLRLARRIFQKYDLAISAQAGDRPSLFARAAGRRAITFASAAKGGALRDGLFSDVVPQTHTHRVNQILSLLSPLGVGPRAELSAPLPDFSFVENQLSSPYVVLHPGAAFRYKEWTISGWRSIARRFVDSGQTVVVTGGAGDSEKYYLDRIFQGLRVLRADGLLSWAELAGVLIRARYFVGVDTSVMHLAAACGITGSAIYGPTDPALWGPHSRAATQPIQVIQSRLPCVPCQQEGCERHVKSHSLCLNMLDADIVWSKIAFTNLSAERAHLKADPDAA